MKMSPNNNQAPKVGTTVVVALVYFKLLSRTLQRAASMTAKRCECGFVENGEEVGVNHAAKEGHTDSKNLTHGWG